MMSTTPTNIDLKWSLWSQDKALWADRAPATWALMEAAYQGLREPLRVTTAPWKEVRMGTVTIYPGYASVHFNNDSDVYIDRIFEAATFPELMHLIDHAEIDLMRAEGANEKCYTCPYPNDEDDPEPEPTEYTLPVTCYLKVRDGEVVLVTLMPDGDPECIEGEDTPASREAVSELIANIVHLNGSNLVTWEG